MTQPCIWFFGPFELDSGRFELRRNGRPLHLERIPMELLILLVSRDGHLVERKEIVDTLWGPGFHLDSEQGINTAVRKLRQILRDNPERPEFVQTVVGKGYRFVGEISRPREASPEPVFGVTSSVEVPEPTAQTIAQVGEVIADADPITIPVDVTRRRPKAALWIVSAAMLALAAAGWFFYPHGGRENASHAIRSLIVLPFVNLSPEPDSEFFSDGLTEEIIDNLARIPNLRLIARTTSFQYKGKSIDIRKVGEEVNVDAVLEGSVRRQGNRLRITAQLNSAKDGYHFWSQTWERERADVFAVQQEIASMVAKGIGASEAAPLAEPKSPTSDMDAYDAYLRGVYFRTKIGVALPAAVTELEHAVKLDPNFAAAYARLADVYNDLGYTFEMPPQVAYPIAKRYANQALKIDPALGEGQEVLGWISAFYDWDWTTAEEAFRKAILLNPADSWAHHNYSHLLVALNRMPEAIAESQRAVDIDPTGARVRGHMAWLYRMTRQPELAIREGKNTLEIAPDDLSTRFYLSEAYEATGQFENAIKDMQGLMPPEFLQAERDGFRKSGEKGYYNTRLSWSLHNPGFPAILKSPHILALLFTRLGHADEAFQELERGLKERDPWLVYLNVDPFYDNIRSDPRFKEIVRRIGLPNRRD